MIVGVLQFAPALHKKEKNFQKVFSLVGSKKLDLLVLPELFSTGYLFSSSDELKKFAEPFDTGETSLFLKELARIINGAVFGGFPELDGNRIFNSGAFFTNDGTCVLYRKSHLFDTEKFIFSPGDTGPIVVEFKGIKLGLAICFDWFFPEFFRTLTLMGADIIAHSANLVMPYFEYSAHLRSLENRVFILTANRTGAESINGKTIKFTGRSIITSPDGRYLLLTEKDVEGLFAVEIDPFEARNKNINKNNNIFADRRKDIYRL